MPSVTITVAVLTFHRPEKLRRGLSLIVEQVELLNADAGRKFSADVVVIDNDPAGGAGPVARSIGSEHVRYIVEPEPGISAGRNRALDETTGRDLLVFIDDDEQPLDGWLTALLDTWSNTRAAAVMGRVVSKFEGELDPWVAAGEFFRRRRMTTGTEITVAAAGNLLLDLDQVRALGVRFDNNLGLSGGEDTLFSRLLVRRGGRIVWCDESVADDYVPADRVTREWVRHRAWSHGNTASLIDLYLADGPARRVCVRATIAGRGALRIAGGLGRYAFGRATRSYRHQARGLRTAGRGAGMLLGAVGLVYQEYARDTQGFRSRLHRVPRGWLNNADAHGRSTGKEATWPS